MQGHKKGAVSIVLIIFIILTLIFAGTTYWMFSESEDAKQRADKTEAELSTRETELVEARQDIKKLNQDVGKISRDFGREESKAEEAERRAETQKGLTESFEEDLQNQRESHREQLNSKEKFIRELRNERNVLKNTLTNLEAQLSEGMDSYSKRIGKLEEEKQEVQKNYQEQLNIRITRINQLEDRIKEFVGRKVKQFENVEPDGTILEANNEKRFVVLDLGKKENVRPGLKFEVFQRRGGGKFVHKGMVEVKEVKEVISFAYIVSLANITDPITRGDFFGSPVFDKNEKKTFHVAGDFEVYQTDDLKKLIKESGGIVLEEIDLYTDFVILGKKNYGKAKEDAIELGIRLMNEHQLLRYLID